MLLALLLLYRCNDFLWRSETRDQIRFFCIYFNSLHLSPPSGFQTEQKQKPAGRQVLSGPSSGIYSLVYSFSRDPFLFFLKPLSSSYTFFVKNLRSWVYMCNFASSPLWPVLTAPHTWTLPHKIERKKKETTPFEKTNQRGLVKKVKFLREPRRKLV